jgi:hypothetical protein
MPKATTSPTSPVDIKPYLVTSTSRDPAKPKTPPKLSSKPKSVGTKARPWTDAERLILFELAVKHGASIKTFEGKIAGRTGKQCYNTWQ